MFILELIGLYVTVYAGLYSASPMLCGCMTPFKEPVRFTLFATVVWLIVAFGFVSQGIIDVRSFTR